MKITSIEKQKKNTEKYNIFIDGTYSFSANDEDVIKYSLKSGEIIDETRLEFLINECEYSKAYKFSLKLVERRDYTIYEMKKKLEGKGYSDKIIDDVINKLMSFGFMNDKSFSERYIKDSIYLKKHGMRKIMYDLNQKGISKEYIEEIELDDDVEYNNALMLAEKKYKLLQGKERVQEKLFRYLASRGYDYEVIKRAISKTVKNEEEIFFD